MSATVPQDHLVPHTSNLPANEGDTVNLFVREYRRHVARGASPASPC
ncbi:hypothetical protein ACRAWF_24545 [Streptomyces sp. L7]